MTNYEWLLQMGGEERQAWFDAQHVDANDVLTRKGDVRADGVCANDVDVSQDSREKLEADAIQLAQNIWHQGQNYANGVREIRHIAWQERDIIELLDRQAAITRREVLTQPDERDEQLAELTAQLYELTAERDALADDLLTCNKEREQYRELFSQAITQAAEIVNLQP